MPDLKTGLKIFAYFILCAAAFCTESRAADLRTALSAQLERELRDEVSLLADSTCFGREFGTGGASGAAFYIFRQLSEAGLDTFFQPFESGGRRGHNVIGITPGKYKSYIVVCAYYDGLGVYKGVRYPGADSNASGVSAMLSLARHFAGRPGGTGIVFAAFDGHGSDLAGSQHFLKTSACKISLLINLDTIGSSLSPVLKQRQDYLIALGGAAYSETLEWANRGVGLHLTYDYYGNKGFTDLFYLRASDQKWFLEKGIPSVMLTSGITAHTNKPTDTPDTLDYPLFVKRLRLLAAWVESLIY